MSIGFWQIAVVVILVVLLFGRGKISSLMGDVAKGIKSFKKGMHLTLRRILSQRTFLKIIKIQIIKKSKSDATNWLV